VDIVGSGSLALCAMGVDTAEMSNGDPEELQKFEPLLYGEAAQVDRVRRDEGRERESVRYEETKFCKNESDIETQGERQRLTD
jgi:hypothetical protein